MGKISIADDCLVPERFIYLRYSGKNPWSVVNRITGATRPFFHVSASGTSQTRLNWDVSTDPIAFYATWWVKKDVSRWSRMLFFLKVQGRQFKTTQEGDFTLQLNADLRTEFSGWGLILKPAWLLYSYLFYNKARRRFIERCRNITLNFRNEIKEQFDLETTAVPRGQGTYG
jgi:hypothetical protein